MNEGISSTSTAVVLDLLAVSEVLDGGVSTDTILLANSLVLGAVNLDDLEVTVVLVGEIVPGGGKTLAVTAPGGIELDEGLARLDDRVEGGISGDDDGGSVFSGSGGLSLGGRGSTDLVTSVGLEERLESLNGASTLVVSGLSVNKHLQSGVSTDTELLADRLVLSTVNLGDLESIGFVAELVPGGGKALAVTAPGGIELHHPDTGGDFIIEVVLSEVDDSSGGDGDENGKEEDRGVHRFKSCEKKNNRKTRESKKT